MLRKIPPILVALLAPGSTRSHQTYYRDASTTFWPFPQGNTFDITNGIRILWP